MSPAKRVTSNEIHAGPIKHHGKEEKHLFVRLAEQWRPGEVGPIGVLLREHEAGRAFIRAVTEARCAATIATA